MTTRLQATNNPDKPVGGYTFGASGYTCRKERKMINKQSQLANSLGNQGKASHRLKSET